jgi:hypothetical protein
MPGKLLSLKEIKELAEYTREASKITQEIKNKSPIANLLKFPQVPSKLSESIVSYILSIESEKLDLDPKKVFSEGKEADLIGITKNGERKKIEVKATGEKAFQYLSAKDITCDYLVWIHFGNYFNNDKDSIWKVFVVKKPSQFFDKPQKIILSKFKKIVGDNIIELDFNLKDWI